MPQVSPMADTELNPKETDATGGIPKAPFVSDVSDFVTSLSDVDRVLGQFQELISKYRFMQESLQKTADNLRDKIPDIEKTYTTVQFLQRRWRLSRPDGEVDDEEEPAGGNDDDDDLDEDELEIERAAAREDMKTHFELNDTLYIEAYIPPTPTCHIWLGANVMVEYPLGEARTMLGERLDTAKKSLATTKERQEFVREQITTMEVNTARIYNWSVEQRRIQRQAESEDK